MDHQNLGNIAPTFLSPWIFQGIFSELLKPDVKMKIGTIAMKISETCGNINIYVRLHLHIFDECTGTAPPPPPSMPKEARVCTPATQYHHFSH
jgi:hypothetical protein